MLPTMKLSGYLDDDVKRELDAGRCVVFTDGCYNPEYKLIGFSGVFLTRSGPSIKVDIVQGQTRENLSARNVTGECNAVIKAIKRLADKNETSVSFFYDYDGIKKWATGEWKAKSPIACLYRRAIEDAKANGMDIAFHKVRAHSGNELNDMADMYAKDAAGVYLSREEHL